MVIGPKIGEDAAVIDLGEGTDSYWVVTSDPITFTTEEIGYYGVVVNVNDIATRGAIPKWFLATLLFPEEETNVDLYRKSFPSDSPGLPTVWGLLCGRSYGGYAWN